ncbi:MAG: DUF1850 domain-containing protein [Clostridiales bacterium]|jgi:hypothetical protein|nr:DUF1850 domain-containing protein [Clostridiales bacterium]
MLKKSKAAVMIAVAAALLIISLIAPSECLIAQCDGRLLFAWRIRPGESFEITFTHSLNLSPITDVIEWTGEELMVRKSVFKAFGAGVPVPSDGIGTELIHREDGYYELTGIDKPMDSITILTQEAPNHRVTFNGNEVFLLELTGSGKQVEIKTEYVTFFSRLILLEGRHAG